MLLEELPPKRLSCIHCKVLVHLVSEELFFILINLYNVQVPNLLDVLVIGLDEVLLDLDLSPENNKLVMKRRVTKLTVH